MPHQKHLFVKGLTLLVQNINLTVWTEYFSVLLDFCDTQSHLAPVHLCRHIKPLSVAHRAQRVESKTTYTFTIQSQNLDDMTQIRNNSVVIKLH